MKGYSETIQRWAKDSRRVGVLAAPDGTGEIGLGAEEAGRKIAVSFTLALQGQQVVNVRYQVFGCGYSMAACAATAELASGIPVSEAMRIDAAQVSGLLEDLPTERLYCAELAVEALHAALASGRQKGATVHSRYLPVEEAHDPQIDAEDPVYSSFITQELPLGVTPEDRHLFACLLAVAAREPYPPRDALGLQEEEFITLQRLFFPDCATDLFAKKNMPGGDCPAEVNEEVRSVLLSHVPRQVSGAPEPVPFLLAKILAARAAHPGHLWVSMGFFQRPELSAAIQRHLPGLFAANHLKMRWKRFLFKEVCTLNGGVLCKSPNCGDCSDYALCFGEGAGG